VEPSNGNGSVAGLLKGVHVRALVWGLLSILTLVGLAYARSYATRLESVEVKVEKIEKMATDIEWIKKYLENRR
jgi:hypothetical protein